MLKIKKILQLSAILAATTAVSAVVPSINHTRYLSTVHADSTIAADGPWETTGDSAKLPLVQQLHNGNEIYYSIKPGDRNTSLFQKSVSDWNALGVIKLVQVNWGAPTSEIAMASSGLSNDESAGDNNINYTYHNGDKFAIMNNVSVTIYKDAQYESKKQQQVTADHELGHALGFDHDNRKINNGKQYKGYKMTMYWTETAKSYKLGGIEQRTLSDHYGIKPSQWLNTNC